MSIPLTPEVALGLLLLFAGFIFYSYRELFSALPNFKSKVLLSIMLLGMIGISIGSRFITPNLVRTFAPSGALYTVLDLAVFLGILFIMFRVFDILVIKLLGDNS